MFLNVSDESLKISFVFFLRGWFNSWWAFEVWSKRKLVMGIISTIFGAFGFGIGVTIGLVIGYFLFIFCQPSDVKVSFFPLVLFAGSSLCYVLQMHVHKNTVLSFVIVFSYSNACFLHNFRGTSLWRNFMKSLNFLTPQKRKRLFPIVLYYLAMSLFMLFIGNLKWWLPYAWLKGLLKFLLSSRTMDIELHDM